MSLNDGSGDAGCMPDTKAFTSADKMRFTSLTYELIEELKMRRELDAENERKIQRLLEERFTVGWKLDQKTSELSSVEEKHEVSLRETRHSVDEKMRELQIEASQHQMYRKLAEKEREALKEDIKKLQLSKFALEKKVRESEHREKLHSSEREQQIMQVSKFESQHGQLDSLMKKLIDKQEKLESDMKNAQDLNKKLLYQNRHQKCVLDMKNEQISQLKEKLLQANIRNKLDPQLVQEEKHTLQRQITSLKLSIKQIEEETRTLEEEKDDWKEKYWDMIRKLDEAHKLITVHLHNASSYRDECKTLEQVRDDTQEKLETTEQALTDSQQLHETLKKELEESVEAWAKERDGLATSLQEKETECNQLMEEGEAQKKEIHVKEETTKQLETELQDALAVLNVAKTTMETQTDLKMLTMTEMGVQAQPDGSTKGIQASADVTQKSSQTINAALCSTPSQTDQREVISAGVQAAVIPLTISKNTQTKQAVETQASQTEPLPNLPIADRSDTQYSHIHINPGVSSSLSVTLPKDQDLKTVPCNMLQREKYNRNSLNKVGQIATSPSKDITAFLPETFENVKESNTVRTESKDKGTEVSKDMVEKFGVHNYITEDTDNRAGGVGKDMVEKFEVHNYITDDTDNRAGDFNKGMVEKFGVHETEASDNCSRELDVGLTVPHHNVQTISHDSIGVVVDPDEFNISLTQDGGYEIQDLAANSGSKKALNRLKSSTIFSSSASGTEAEEKTIEDEVILLSDTDNEIEKAVENQWICDDNGASKLKGDKRKLSSTAVLEHFTKFDQARERFPGTVRQYADECTQSKQPKLVDTQSGQRDENHQETIAHSNKNVPDEIEQTPLEKRKGKSDAVDKNMALDHNRNTEGEKGNRNTSERQNSFSFKRQPSIEKQSIQNRYETRVQQDICAATSEEMTKGAESVPENISCPTESKKSLHSKSRIPQIFTYSGASQNEPMIPDFHSSTDEKDSGVRSQALTDNTGIQMDNRALRGQQVTQSAADNDTKDTADTKGGVKLSGQDLLQKYQNIVASLRPKKAASLHRPETDTYSGVGRGQQRQFLHGGAATTLTDVPNMQRFSPRGSRSVSILREQAGTNRRNKKVSWNEKVQHKEF